jgi:pimeloyl-ACP methyl ester carboxylesterase
MRTSACDRQIAHQAILQAGPPGADVVELGARFAAEPIMLPILLIHGFPLDSTVWHHQAEFLRQQGRRVFTPDLPGFGTSPDGPAPPRERASIEAYAELIHEQIVRDCGGKAIVGGLSMGGYILLALLRDHPDDVAAAMFIDTRAEADSSDIRAARLQSIEEVQRNGPGSLVQTMLERMLGKTASAEVKKHTREIMERQPPEAIIAAQSAMAKRRDQSDLLPELTKPVLIVVGAEDKITPPSVALAMQSHMPHAMVVQIVSAGHLAIIEQPQAVNGALQAFLATVREEA